MLLPNIPPNVKIALGTLFLVMGVLISTHTHSAELTPGVTPVGWAEMCEDDPDLCVSVPDDLLTHSGDLMVKLHIVNTAVNNMIQPRNDPNGHDIWQVSSFYGDCEDYALTKREKLVEAFGFSRGALRIAVLRDPFNHQGHANLLVFTDHGIFVLDNLFHAVRRFDAYDSHLWISREGENSWLSLRTVTTGS